MPKTVNAQVHRFRDCVALYVATGETVYLSAKDARKFARAINKAIKSVETESFSDSKGTTQAFAFTCGKES